MRWQIMKNGLPLNDTFDDGIPFVGPGDEDFTTVLVDAEVTRMKADSRNYVGCSYPPAEE